jgi:hypothetical protein
MILDEGPRPEEAKLEWMDLNIEAGTVDITAVKGHRHGVLRVADLFPSRSRSLPERLRRNLSLRVEIDF